MVCGVRRELSSSKYLLKPTHPYCRSTISTKVARVMEDGVLPQERERERKRREGRGGRHTAGHII